MISARPRVHACPLHLVIHLGGGGRTRFSSVRPFARKRFIRRCDGGGGGSEKGKTSCDFGVSRALPLGHEKGYRRVASSSLLWRSEGGGERRALVWVPSTYQY